MSEKKPVVCVDAGIPYVDKRLEPWCEVRVLRSPEFTAAEVCDADALMIRTRTRCDAALLQVSKVRFIATATIGTDHIDLPWCHANGIEVANAPGCNAPAVAQYVWATLLRLGYRARGLRLGVIGCGNVGSIVTAWGKALGAEVLVSDPPKREAELKSGGVAELMSGRVEYASLEEIAGWCDVLTLHTPYTKTGRFATHHLVDDRIMDLMRPGALLINAARGGVTDTDALVKVLREGKIRAAIDCWEGEPRISRELLELVDSATFHIAGYSRQGKQRATRMALQAVGKHFGFVPDTEGLEGEYRMPETLTEERIMADFDPAPLTALLRERPEEFDVIRSEYRLREETNGN